MGRFRIVAYMMLLLLAGSCISRKTVLRDKTLMEQYYLSSIETERGRYLSVIDSLRIEAAVRDTCWFADSVTVRTEFRNDTVFVMTDRIRNLYRSRAEQNSMMAANSSRDSIVLVHDTVYQQLDAVSVQREKTKTSSSASNWILVFVLTVIVVAVLYVRDKYRE